MPTKPSLIVFALLVAGPSPAEEPVFRPATDSALRQLIDESLAARPEIKEADAAVRAERERVPQVGALPDPTVSVGIQNDGFGSIEIGRMETSYAQLMATQAFPWPGKRDLRREVARLGVEQVEARLARVRLTAEAEVRRAYLEIIVARDRLALLGKLEGLWEKSEKLARARYESGAGAQSDILRAQLERSRLRQRRWSLETEESASSQTLNRVRGRPLDEAIVTPSSVRQLELSGIPFDQAARADAERRSPELALARLEARRAQKQIALGQRDLYPDIAVTAGIMPRGALEPMWLASVGVNLPVFAGTKQRRAIEESRARGEAGERGADAVAQVLGLRTRQRLTVLRSLSESIQLYRAGLLVQSEATVESTMSQYGVGRVTFASVLEALVGYLGDEDSYLAALAQAHRVTISGAEVSLEAPGFGAGGGMGGAPIPGAGAMESSGAMSSGRGATPVAAPPTSGSMSKM